LLDEAQDTNSVTLSIFNNLPGRKIRVGDSHQAIYSFRGAINGINDRAGSTGKNTRKSLTTTFRCLPHIVDQANWILGTFKGEKQKIVSGNNREPVIETVGVLARTNASLIEQMDSFSDFNLTRSPEIIFESLLSVLNWKYGFDRDIAPQFKFLNRFKTMGELSDYIQATDDQELKMAVKALEKYDSPEWAAKGFPYGKKIRAIFEKACNNYKHNGSSNVTLSSAHSSKGLEFDKVYLLGDFPDMISVIAKLMENNLVETPEDFFHGKKYELVAAREEVNLYYVAVTRAKYELSDKTPAASLYKEGKSIYEIFGMARSMAQQFAWKREE
jgi:superfamily I DNA/RNA helicase